MRASRGGAHRCGVFSESAAVKTSADVIPAIYYAMGFLQDHVLGVEKAIECDHDCGQALQLIEGRDMRERRWMFV